MGRRKKTELQRKNKRRCRKCNSTFGYYKVREKAWQCRACSYLDKDEKIETEILDKEIPIEEVLDDIETEEQEEVKE